MMMLQAVGKTPVSNESEEFKLQCISRNGWGSYWGQNAKFFQLHGLFCNDAQGQHLCEDQLRRAPENPSWKLGQGWTFLPQAASDSTNSSADAHAALCREVNSDKKKEEAARPKGQECHVISWEWLEYHPIFQINYPQHLWQYIWIHMHVPAHSGSAMYDRILIRFALDNFIGFWVGVGGPFIHFSRHAQEAEEAEAAAAQDWQSCHHLIQQPCFFWVFLCDCIWHPNFTTLDFRFRYCLQHWLKPSLSAACVFGW